MNKKNISHQNRLDLRSNPVDEYLQREENKIIDEVMSDGAQRARLFYELNEEKKPNFSDIQDLDYLSVDSPEGDDLNRLGISLSPGYFKKQKQKFLHAFARGIRMSKDIAIEHGVNPDIANIEQILAGKEDEQEVRKTYNEAIDKEREKLEQDEFSAKNLILYCIFGLLLCTGDLLMGEYLAKEILGLGHKWWGGLILAIFVIALGVVMEIVLSMLYKNQKWLAQVIMGSSLVFTLLMFAAMGVLRSSQFNMALTGSASLDQNALFFFFIGMSLSAPTALGSVLFIIQKKIDWIRRKNKLDRQQQHLGRLMNLLVEFKEKEKNYENILIPAYIRGYVGGMGALMGISSLVKPDEVDKVDKSSGKSKASKSLLQENRHIEEEEGGDLISRMKRDVRQHYKLSSIAGLLICILLFSCSPNDERREYTVNRMSFVILDNEKKETTNFILSQIPESNISSIGVHFPEGSMHKSFEGFLSSTLLNKKFQTRKHKKDIEKFISELELPKSQHSGYSLEIFGTLLTIHQNTAKDKKSIRKSYCI